MLIFAHAGITLGAATLVNRTLNKIISTPETDVSRTYTEISHKVSAGNNPSPESRPSWFVSLGNRIDIRILLIGSLLPDIIDKSFGQIFFRETFSNGRILGHTLLFTLVIALIGLYLYLHSHKNGLLVLSFGTFVHLILDEMWCLPKTLFWPFFGFAFERVDLTDYIISLLHTLLTVPKIYITELIGIAVLIWFAISLIYRKKLRVFVKYGKTG